MFDADEELVVNTTGYGVNPSVAMGVVYGLGKWMCSYTIQVELGKKENDLHSAKVRDKIKN